MSDRFYTGKDVETDGWTTVYASDCDVTKRYTPAPPATRPPLTQIDGRGKDQGRGASILTVKTALWHITLTAALIVVLAWSGFHIKAALTSEPGVLTE